MRKIYICTIRGDVMREVTQHYTQNHAIKKNIKILKKSATGNIWMCPSHPPHQFEHQ